MADLLGLPPRNECRATRSGLVIDVRGRMVTCPSLVYSRFYKGNEMPYFDKNFLDNWQNHSTFVDFRNRGLRECQAMAHIFSGRPDGYDPYGIKEFQKFKANSHFGK